MEVLTTCQLTVFKRLKLNNWVRKKRTGQTTVHWMIACDAMIIKLLGFTRKKCIYIEEGVFR